MRKILIFIDWFLPGYKAGGPVRSYTNLIDHFKKEYQFNIVTRNTDYTETKPYQGITADVWTEHEKNVFVWYCSAGFPSRKNFEKLIEETDWDVLYINGIYSWYFSILPLLVGRRNAKGKIVVSVRGMLKKSAVNVKPGKKKLFLGLIKLRGLYKGIILHATNEEEKQEILNIFGNHLNIHVAPNLPRRVNGSFQNREKIQGKLNLISIARISPEKNTLYALEVLKGLSLLKNSELISHNTNLRPPVSGFPFPCQQTTSNNRQPATLDFILYGSVYNQQYWEECQKVLKELPDWIKVTYNGSLDSNNVLTKLSQSHFFFMPTRGENFGHAILESLSAGCPVIISDQTPWRKLEEKGIGWDISLNDTQKFLDAVEQCLAMDQEKYDQMSKKAYEYARKIINDPEVIEKNRRLFL